MEIFYLLVAGVPVSFVHWYLVWHHSDNRKYSISEHAIIDKQSYLLYVATHVFTVVFFLLYSYDFFVPDHRLLIAFWLIVVFAVLDLVQAAVPSRGKTEIYHIAAAYTSWVCYIVAGLLALFKLDISEPYRAFAGLLMIPILSMFVYMHISRSKLYPYQLLMVPMYVIVMLLITIGV